MYADCLVRSKLMFLSHLSEFFICSLSDLSRKLANAGDQVDVAALSSNCDALPPSLHAKASP